MSTKNSTGHWIDNALATVDQLQVIANPKKVAGAKPNAATISNEVFALTRDILTSLSDTDCPAPEVKSTHKGVVVIVFASEDNTRRSFIEVGSGVGVKITKHLAKGPGLYDTSEAAVSLFIAAAVADTVRWVVSGGIS